MNSFPAVDPIPLPAPVWLFKGLHIFTLGLHFVAVELLLGGLLVALVFNLMGRRQKNATASLLRLNAAASITRRLPMVVTYVINLGVPPLLFAQVLYGRALYTSSVLIGAFWISVVFLLMACYWHVYRFTAKAEAGKRAWPMGLGAWLMAVAIAMIFSTNMTLMLRPEVWGGMYAVTASGTHLPPHDPTLLPRWLFMLTGSLLIAGLGMIWLASRPNLKLEVRAFLAAQGGRLTLVMAMVQVFMAMNVIRMQPDLVQQGLTGTVWYRIAGYVWLGMMGVMVFAGAWSAFVKPASAGVGWLAMLSAVLSMQAMALFRDGIRDLTLASKGFDVWDRTVVTNGSVVGLFLVFLVAGLAAMGWLMVVMKRANPVAEEVVG
jgi:hypothetical protein